VALLALALLAPALEARAQSIPRPIDAPSPTRGLAIPNAAIAGAADATSVTLNPGQLGFAETGSGALVIDQWKDAVLEEGRGWGLFATVPLVARSLSAGASFEWLRPSLPGPDDYRKLTLGLGGRLGRALAMGATWERLFASMVYGNLGTWSLGWELRPHDTVAAGFVIRDVFRPRPPNVIGAARLPREYDGEIAIRPFGTPRLELAGGLRALSDDDDTRWLPHARLSFTVLPGLAIFATGESSRSYVAAVGVPTALVARTRENFRVAAGLTFSFDRASITAAGLGTFRRTGEGDVTDDSGLGAPGLGLVLRSNGLRQPALVTPVSVARLKLDGLEVDRNLLGALVALRRLRDDPAAGAVLLEIGDLDPSFGRIDELRALVVELAQRKPVFALLANPGTAEYYLASACHQIAMHPAGGLTLTGLAQNVTFWKGAMDKLGVAVDLVRIAEYKGAMEPFVLEHQSQPVLDNRNALLDDLYTRVVNGIVTGRQAQGFDFAKVGKLIDRGLYSPAQAKDVGLIDAIGDSRDAEDLVKKWLGRNIAIRDADPTRFASQRWQPKRVAVILVDGAITDGDAKGFSPTAGQVAWSDPIIAALKQVRRDPSVRAVILRVNSPGGSAFASDRIYREVKRLREAKKPVIVSMGDSAASGGYYVAAPADTILASPSSVTGSIGIFAYKVDVSGLAARLAINTEIHTRGTHAGLYSPWKGWDEGERALIGTRLAQSYQQFLRIVADGRKSRGITEARANDLGRGRVYTGTQALKVGLVDRLGGFTEALAEATQRGGVPVAAGGVPELLVLPKPPVDTLASLLALRGLLQAESGADEEGFAGESAGVNVVRPAAAEAIAAYLLPRGKAVARLVLPVLLGKGRDIAAQMPYELEFK
jgi:protease-4